MHCQREPQLFVQGCRVVDLRDALPTRGAANPYPTRPLAAITTAVVHYSGVDRDSSALEIAQYQTAKTEGDLFPAIAYHFVVRQEGLVEQCHDLGTRTWHAGTQANDVGIAICLPMLYGPTDAQIDATSRLIAALGDRLETVLQVKGHKEFTPTPCPGPEWETWRARLRRPPTPPRERYINGIPVKWAFLDWYRRLEAIRPGLCGPPLAVHVRQGNGSARQDFAGCTLIWRDGQMTIIPKPKHWS